MNKRNLFYKKWESHRRNASGGQRREVNHRRSEDHEGQRRVEESPAECKHRAEMASR